MCFDPLSIAGAGASVGGQLLQSRERQAGADREAAARRAQHDAEQARQRAFQGEAGQAFDKSVSAFTPESQAAARDKAVADRTNTLTAAQKGGAYVPTSGSAPSIVQTAIMKAFEDAAGRSRTSAEALGRLGAYGDVNLGNNITLGQSGNRLSDIMDMSSRSAALLPYEMSVASRNAYRPPSVWGDLLKYGGMAAGVAGAAGKGPSFSDIGGWFSGPGMGFDGMPWMVP